MFTGLISDVGTLIKINKDKIFSARISCNYDFDNTSEGASICHDGVCLTIFDKIKEKNGFSYKVEISDETLSKTNILNPTNPWNVGKNINLEKSLKIGEELGGHIVTGHIDGVAQLINIQKIDKSQKLTFKLPNELQKFVAVKGSIAINGTSLTVNGIDKNQFTVNIIPHTQKVTTWSEIKKNDLFNIEIDLLARYIERLQATRN